MLGAAFSPQTALWLLFALVLARPLRREYIVFTVVQVVYYVAIWGYLSGHLTPEKTGNPRLYFLAIGLRLLVDLGLVVLFYRDILRPVHDPLRAPDWSDPLGGVLIDGEGLDPIDDEVVVEPDNETLDPVDGEVADPAAPLPHSVT